MISKHSNNVRCSASESRTGQPSVSRRWTRTAIRRLLLSIDRTGLSGVSPQDAPLIEIDDLSGETEPHDRAWRCFPITAMAGCLSYRSTAEPCNWLGDWPA